MPLFAAGSTHSAKITMSNPNPAPIAITFDLVVGATRAVTTKGSATGTIATNSSGSFIVSVPMPLAKGNYPLKLWLDYNGYTIEYDAGTVDIYILVAPTVTVTW